MLRCGRRYLLDFAPFAALILAYAELRGIAHLLHPHPYYLPQLRAEKFLFHGRVPTVALQDWLWSGSTRWHDWLLLGIVQIHSIVPTTLAFVLWLRRRALFYRFAASMLILSYAAAFTFWLYPAAPPWAAAQSGLLTVTRIDVRHLSSSSVPSGVGTLNNLVHDNPYAAIPSLHGGYAFLVFLFIVTMAWPTRWRWKVIGLAALYPALQSFAAVYTGNHYVIDLLIGFGYATAAVLGLRLVWRRLAWPT